MQCIQVHPIYNPQVVDTAPCELHNCTVPCHSKCNASKLVSTSGFIFLFYINGSCKLYSMACFYDYAGPPRPPASQFYYPSQPTLYILATLASVSLYRVVIKLYSVGPVGLVVVLCTSGNHCYNEDTGSNPS